MASPFFSPFRRPPVNPFGSMMGFGMGPNLFSGGMPFYNPFPRMPMYGGGFGGFGGMGGGFNPFIMTPPPMQRFPRYDSLIPMQSQMPSQSLQDLPYQPKRPEMNSIEKIRQMNPDYGMDNRPKKFDPNVDRLSPGTDLSTAVDDRGVPIFGGRDTPKADFKPFDPSDLQSRLDALENRQMPTSTPFDPSGLQTRLSALENRQMPTFTPFDPSGLQARLDALENRQMPTFTPFDPSGLQARLDALENRQTPSYTPFDPTGLQSRLRTLENRQMFDPSELQSQIDALQNRQTPMFDPSGLQSRLNTLEDRIQKTGNINMADIEALIEQRLSDSLRNMNFGNQNEYSNKPRGFDPYNPIYRPLNINRPGDI